MTEKLESASSTSISGRLSVHRSSRSRSSQLDPLITHERFPLFYSSKSSSACSSRPLSINSDPQDCSDSELTFEQNDSNTSFSLGNCGRDCLARFNVCRGISCRRMFYDRFPKGRAVFIVLLINTLESFALFGAFTGIQERIIGPQSNIRHLAYLFVFFQWCGGRIFYPITGLIADTCLGRYKMIKIGLWLMWIGFVVITINENLVYYYYTDSTPNHSHAGEISLKYLLPIIAAMLLIISSGSVEANIIPFGVDQIQQGALSSEMSSYFYYYYFSRVTGLLLGVVLFLSLFSLNSIHFGLFINPTHEQGFIFSTLNAIHPLFAVVAITIALILHFCTSQQYFKDRDYSNPLRLIVNIVYYAATVKRQPPRYRRAFRYGEGRKSRIELAKIEYDGIFTSEEVEDVKTFFRICLVIISLSGVFLIFGMTLSALEKQVTATSKAVFSSELLQHEFFHLLFFCVSLLSNLAMNHLIIPLLPGFRMKLKIVTGVVFITLVSVMALIIQFVVWKRSSSQSTHLFWLILPIIFLSIGDMHIFTAGLEFIYAQSPNSMKGLLTGFFYLWYGIFQGTGIIFSGNFVTDLDKQAERITIYYAIGTCVGVISVILYLVVACTYRNRVRPENRDDIEDDAVRKGMYGNVSTLNFPDRGNN